MTLEEMIIALESEKRSALSNMSYETAEQIIAALRRLEHLERAGQLMRYELRPLHGFDLTPGAQAWDAAYMEGLRDNHPSKAREQAEAACRAREVFPVPAHEGVAAWVEVKR